MFTVMVEVDDGTHHLFRAKSLSFGNTEPYKVSYIDEDGAQQKLASNYHATVYLMDDTGKTVSKYRTDRKKSDSAPISATIWNKNFEDIAEKVNKSFEEGARLAKYLHEKPSRDKLSKDLKNQGIESGTPAYDRLMAAYDKRAESENGPPDIITAVKDAQFADILRGRPDPNKEAMSQYEGNKIEPVTQGPTYLNR